MPWTLLERFQKYNWDTTEANKDTIFSARFGREQHTWRVLAQTAEAYFDEQCGRHGQPIHFDRWRPGESIRYKSYWSLFADKVASTTFGGESVAKHRDRDICLEWSMDYQWLQRRRSTKNKRELRSHTCGLFRCSLSLGGLGLKASAPSRVVTVSSAAAFIPEMLKMFESLSRNSFSGLFGLVVQFWTCRDITHRTWPHLNDKRIRKVRYTLLSPRIGGIVDAAPAADFDKAWCRLWSSLTWGSF